MMVLGYIGPSCIKVIRDGEILLVPDDPANPDRAAIAMWEAEGNVIPLNGQVPPAFSPLTARQLRIGLVSNGFALEQVETAIEAIEDPQQRAVAQIEWEYASQFERAHPLIAQVGAALGLTAEQIDAMWQQSLTL